jgi:predicted LPLAT superfamily acyltransferase
LVAVLQSTSGAIQQEPSATSAVKWTGRTRGGYFGNWFFVQLIRRLGLRWAYAWLVLVAAWFTVAAASSRRASLAYLERVLGPQPLWKRPLLVFRHFYSFGVALLDRAAVIMGRSNVQCRFEGETLFRAYLDRGQGVLLLGAHLGNWEIGGQFLGRFGIPVNLVVLEKEEARVRKLFAKALEGRRFKLLTTDEHPLRSIPIISALRHGEIVALHGDRSFGGADLETDFLGGKARFPVGPYLLAAASKAPLFQVFVVRERLGAYRFFSFPAQFVPRETLRRQAEGVRSYVAQYAERLEEVARQYPFQWYNIYDFWTETKVRDERG